MPPKGLMKLQKWFCCCAWKAGAQRSEAACRDAAPHGAHHRDRAGSSALHLPKPSPASHQVGKQVLMMARMASLLGSDHIRALHFILVFTPFYSVYLLLLNLKKIIINVEQYGCFLCITPVP